MIGLIGEFRLGEDIALELEVAAGDPASVVAVTAAMKPAKTMANRPVLDDAANPIALAIAPHANGWTVSLPSTASAALGPGLYGIDARLQVAGGIEITEQTAFIALSEGALS
jgi:hypothetical protein